MLLARRRNFAEVARVTEKVEHSWSAAYYTSEQTVRKLYGERDKASPYRYGMLQFTVTLITPFVSYSKKPRCLFTKLVTCCVFPAERE